MTSDVGRSAAPPEGPEVLLIAGPAGAGKTVAADEWARTRPYPCAHISLDEVRGMIRSGFADPLDGWGPEPGRQYRLTRGSAALLARRFIGAGFRCVIDDAIFPDWPEADYPGWQRELEGIPHRLVVLLPSLDVVIQRDGERPPDSQVGLKFVKIIHEMMTPWENRSEVPVIDNSSMSILQTVVAIEAALGHTPRQVEKDVSGSE